MFQSQNQIIFLIGFAIFLIQFTQQLTDTEIPSFEELDIHDDFSAVDNVGFDSSEISLPKNPLAEASPILKAVCLIRGPRAYGVVRLIQVGIGPTLVSGFVAGLNPFQMHGFHVHEYRSDGGDCESAGEHYNPTHQHHGSPETLNSHLGDLGNLQADGLGVSRFHVTSPKIQLRGKFSVIERSLVVHTRPDDLGMGMNRESLKSGNSGGRIGCGTIKFVSIG